MRKIKSAPIPCFSCIRFVSKNKSEIYRSQLKTRVNTKTETIPQLATSVQLIKPAYPGINQDAIEALSLDNFVHAMPDSGILLD